MNVNSFGKYRNFLLPLMDSISVILGYYLMSVLITDSFLMHPESLIIGNEILISIILAIVILQIVFRLTKRYANIIRYETNQDYIMYILLSVISLLVVSLIEEIIGMKNPSIKFNLTSGIIIGIITIAYRLVIRYALLSDIANKGINYTPENQEKLLIIGGGYSANNIIKTLQTSLKGK